MCVCSRVYILFSYSLSYFNCYCVYICSMQLFVLIPVLVFAKIKPIHIFLCIKSHMIIITIPFCYSFCIAYKVTHRTYMLRYIFDILYYVLFHAFLYKNFFFALAFSPTFFFAVVVDFFLNFIFLRTPFVCWICWHIHTCNGYLYWSTYKRTHQHKHSLTLAVWC